MPQWLQWRMQHYGQYWYSSERYYYPYQFRLIPEIFSSITENNI